MVDFGFAKRHLTKKGYPYKERKKLEFHGTINYASVNAHLNRDLGRKDDLWSFFFVLLEFLNEELPWRYISKDQVPRYKTIIIDRLNGCLFKGPTRKLAPVHEIFSHLKLLSYEDKPDYQLIRMCLSRLQRSAEGTITTCAFTDVPNQPSETHKSLLDPLPEAPPQAPVTLTTPTH